MITHRLAILLSIALYGCASTEALEREYSPNFDEINSICMVDGNIDGCKDIHGTEVSLVGIIKRSGETSFILSPNNSFETLDELWRNSIQIAGSLKFRSKAESFEGETVRVTGTLHSSCVERVTKKNSSANLQDGQSDEVIIRMLTGTCHYINNRAFFNATIVPHVSN